MSTQDNEYFLPPIVVEPYLLRAGSWAIPFSWINEIRNAGGKGKGEIIAVCDTGGDTSHPWLKDKYAIAPWSNVPGEDWRDGNNHGRHCQGTAFGADPEFCFAVEAMGMSGKCLSNRGSGYDTGIIAAGRKAVENGATFVSFSIGGGGYNPEFDKWGQEATAAGVVIVVASGNERQAGGTTTYPARYPWALRVGSVRSDGRYSSFSNPGQDRNTLTTGFPGEQIPSAGPNGSVISMSGTSMATPGFVGALACVQSLRTLRGLPRWKTEDFRQWAGSWSADAGPAGADPDYGPGWFDGRLVLNSLEADPPPLKA